MKKFAATGLFLLATVSMTMGSVLPAASQHRRSDADRRSDGQQCGRDQYRNAAYGSAEAKEDQKLIDIAIAIAAAPGRKVVCAVRTGRAEVALKVLVTFDSGDKMYRYVYVDTDTKQVTREADY